MLVIDGKNVVLVSRRGIDSISRLSRIAFVIVGNVNVHFFFKFYQEQLSRST